MHKKIKQRKSQIHYAIFAQIFEMPQQYPNPHTLRWTFDLVGTPARLLLNMIGFTVAGLISITYPTYSWLILLFCGALIPSLFSYCLLNLLLGFAERFDLPQASMLNPLKMKLMLVLDVMLLFAFILLIIYDVWSSPIFKVIACPIIPSVQLLCLRAMIFFNHKEQ